MGTDELLMKAVEQGWHALAGVYVSPGIRPIGTRKPGEPPVFDEYRTLPLLGKGSELLYIKGMPGQILADGYTRPITREVDGAVTYPRDGHANVGHSPGYLQESRHDHILVVPESKGIFRTKPAQYRTETVRTYVPARVTAEGRLSAAEGDLVHCLTLDFPDKRWDDRGGVTARYAVAMREQLCNEIEQLVEKHPALMLELYSRAFPEHRAAVGARAFPEITTYRFVRT